MVFQRVDVIFDVTTALKGLLNESILYAQVPHKMLFKRHPTTQRCHMVYSVFSDEPLQPPEPVFLDLHAEVPEANIAVATFSPVGGREKFMTEGLGLPLTVAKMSPEQAMTMSVVGQLERDGVFSNIIDGALTLREQRCVKLSVSLSLSPSLSLSLPTDLDYSLTHHFSQRFSDLWMKMVLWALLPMISLPLR